MELDTILCQVTDMNRAAAFYRDVLGLKPGISSPYWSDFEMGFGKLGLHPIFKEGAPTGRGGWVIGLASADLKRLRVALERAGVRIGDYHDVPGGVVLDFDDPDGNPIQVIQRGVALVDFS